ncbi:MAG TPA: cytochrome d ubiquinol oxidase subunit II [Acidimicrobiales bacterium]|nr:cytochrome d ubiquinol oxidase subunit II [Acidimicrobiales bacterium]
MPVASLNTAWFALIGLLWAGYFVLEGFDFGVGVLTPLVARDDVERRLCINAIGPVWDGNEVWLIVAGGATFAAFPTWYATMFSGFYLALFLVLAALIVRGVSFEFRGKERAPAWRATWDRALFVGSLVPAFLWGVAFTDLVHGLPITAGAYTGGLLGLVHPIALLGGVASLALFTLHGAVFLSAKTTGELSARAGRVARRLAWPVAALVAGLVAWVAATAPAGSSAALSGAVPIALGAVAVAAVAVGGTVAGRGRDLPAFATTAVGILALSAAAFCALFPRVMVSSVPGRSLTVWNAASGHETLLVMTVVAAIFTPLVLAYQGWSYWVFRQRLVRPPQPAPGPRT